MRAAVVGVGLFVGWALHNERRLNRRYGQGQRAAYARICAEDRGDRYLRAA